MKKFVIAMLIFIPGIIGYADDRGHYTSDLATSEIRGMTTSKIIDAGVDYSRGTNGKPVNAVMACDCFQIAANRPQTYGKKDWSDLAMQNLANCYRTGDGRKKDLPKAWAWHMLASEYASEKTWKEAYRNWAVVVEDEMSSAELTTAASVKEVLEKRYK